MGEEEARLNDATKSACRSYVVKLLTESFPTIPIMKRILVKKSLQSSKFKRFISIRPNSGRGHTAGRLTDSC